MRILRIGILVLSALLLVPGAAAAATAWNEAVNGDLSDLPAAPTVLTFVPGENLVSAITQPGDPDYFTVTIAAGMQLDAAVLNAYTGTSPAFWGVLAGTSWPAQPGFGDLMSGGLFGAGNVGQDVLQLGGVGLPALAGPLGPGDYLFWLNETVSVDEYTIDFQVSAVPVPAAAWFLLSALPMLGVRRLRRS